MALSAAVQFSALKSIMFSYPEWTGLKRSLMGLAKAYRLPKGKRYYIMERGPLKVIILLYVICSLKEM